MSGAFTCSGKSATALIVGCMPSASPTFRAMPLRRRSAGVCTEPAQTKTVSASISSQRGGHPRGACAADSFGRMHGIPNLHLADASLLCSAPGVNPQGSIMAFARRNALAFLGER